MQPTGPRESRITLEGEDTVRESRAREWFSLVARRVSEFAGRPWVFALAVLTILVWASTGPVFGFSDTWQLVINTSTTIVTFLMVFLIQSTQNKDTLVIHVKLNELIAATPRASNYLIDLEDMSEADLERLERAFQRLADKAEEKRGQPMTVEDSVRSIHEDAEQRKRRRRSRYSFGS